MHSATASVGVAVNDMLPQITLPPFTGTQSLVGSATQTVFDCGAPLHKKRAADEALVQSAAQYRSTVISAFQNVADTLHALLSDADALKAAVASERAARVTLDLTRRQSQVGYVNFLTLLRWSPKTGQVAKRESPFGTAGWPEVRHGKYTEEAQS